MAFSLLRLFASRIVTLDTKGEHLCSTKTRLWCWTWFGCWTIIVYDIILPESTLNIAICMMQYYWAKSNVMGRYWWNGDICFYNSRQRNHTRNMSQFQHSFQAGGASQFMVQVSNKIMSCKFTATVFPLQDWFYKNHSLFKATGDEEHNHVGFSERPPKMRNIVSLEV